MQCKKQLQQTLPDHPGKTPEHRILKMNSFNSGIMIDLLPSIKIRTTTNQKSTRNATVLNCHILLGVDVATKFSSFVIINSRNSVDIQNGLSALCVKIGKKATTFFQIASQVLSALLTVQGGLNIQMEFLQEMSSLDSFQL